MLSQVMRRDQEWRIHFIPKLVTEVPLSLHPYILPQMTILFSWDQKGIEPPLLSLCLLNGQIIPS